MHSDEIGFTALVLVLLTWVLFGLRFLLRKKHPLAEAAKYGPESKWGIALQSVGFALAWSLPRRQWWPFKPSLAGEILLAVVAVALAWSSALLSVRAVKALGQQWTYQARVIKGHELVTQGPYRIVRNPIYLGMFGLLLATGLVFSRWWTLLAALAFFLIGNHIRISAEEKLLREAFGPSFDDYARQVPAFFPRLLRSR